MLNMDVAGQGSLEQEGSVRILTGRRSLAKKSALTEGTTEALVMSKHLWFQENIFSLNIWFILVTISIIFCKFSVYLSIDALSADASSVSGLVSGEMTGARGELSGTESFSSEIISGENVSISCILFW